MRGARWLVVVWLGLGGCARPPPPPASTLPGPPPAPPVRVPDGCLASLAGEWRHADDSSYVYGADDDGGQLTLRAHRVVAVDAGFVPRRFGRLDGGVDGGGSPAASPDAGEPAFDAGAKRAVPSRGAVVTLRRTPEGFVGLTSAEVALESGRVCPVTFPTEVMSCSDGGLILRSEPGTVLGELCQVPAHPPPVEALVHRLVRPGPDSGP